MQAFRNSVYMADQASRRTLRVNQHRLSRPPLCREFQVDIFRERVVLNLQDLISVQEVEMLIQDSERLDYGYDAFRAFIGMLVDSMKGEIRIKNGLRVLLNLLPKIDEQHHTMILTVVDEQRLKMWVDKAGEFVLQSMFHFSELYPRWRQRITQETLHKSMARMTTHGSNKSLLIHLELVLMKLHDHTIDQESLIPCVQLFQSWMTMATDDTLKLLQMVSKKGYYDFIKRLEITAGVSSFLTNNHEKYLNAAVSYLNVLEQVSLALDFLTNIIPRQVLGMLKYARNSNTWSSVEQDDKAGFFRLVARTAKALLQEPEFHYQAQICLETLQVGLEMEVQANSSLPDLINWLLQTCTKP